MSFRGLSMFRCFLGGRSLNQPLTLLHDIRFHQLVDLSDVSIYGVYFCSSIQNYCCSVQLPYHRSHSDHRRRLRDLQHINGVLQHGSRLRSVSTTIWAMFLWTKISGYVSVTSLAFTRLSEHTIQAIGGAPLAIAIPKQSGNATRKPPN